MGYHQSRAQEIVSTILYLVSNISHTHHCSTLQRGGGGGGGEERGGEGEGRGGERRAQLQITYYLQAAVYDSVLPASDPLCTTTCVIQSLCVGSIFLV